MANITQPVRCRDSAGIRTRRVVAITGPASYATGGFACTASELFLGLVEFFPSVVGLDANGVTPRLFVYDYVNEKIKAFVPNTGAEVGGGTDLSGYTFRVEAIGK